jgi:hypothetical protein
MNILNFFANFLKRLRRDGRRDPAHDWLALVTVSLIALVGIVVWHMWVFDTVATGGAIGAPGKVATSTASNRIPLDAIRAIFENRSAEEAKYTSGVYRYTDPSQ